MALRTVVLDNGSGTLKVGFAGEDQPRFEFPNGMGQTRGGKKTLGEGVWTVGEYFLHRPCSDSLVLDPELQSDLWEVAFDRDHLNIDPKACGILVSEPFNAPSVIRQLTADILFEDFGFKELVISPAQHLARGAFPPDSHECFSDEAVEPGSCAVVDLSKIASDPGPPSGAVNNPCSLVVDLGFQCCHALPLVTGMPIGVAAQRIPIGGMHLNSFLKNQLGLTHYNLDYSELLVQHIREETCFISQDFEGDITKSQETLGSIGRRNLPQATHLFGQYNLPDFNVRNKQQLLSHFRTHGNRAVFSTSASENDNCLRLNGERITAPELLFRPQDAQVDCAGIQELAQRAVLTAPIDVQSLLSSKILLCGGLAQTKGLAQRFASELRSLLPQEWPVRVFTSKNSAHAAWVGGSQWAIEADNWSLYATKRPYT